MTESRGRHWMWNLLKVCSFDDHKSLQTGLREQRGEKDGSVTRTQLWKLTLHPVLSPGHFLPRDIWQCPLWVVLLASSKHTSRQASAPPAKNRPAIRDVSSPEAENPYAKLTWELRFTETWMPVFKSMYSSSQTLREAEQASWFLRVSWRSRSPGPEVWDQPKVPWLGIQTLGSSSMLIWLWWNPGDTPKSSWNPMVEWTHAVLREQGCYWRAWLESPHSWQ